MPAGAAPPDSLLGLLGVQRVRYAVCSPFAALSGVGDEFSSMDDLGEAGRGAGRRHWEQQGVLHAADRSTPYNSPAHAVCCLPCSACPDPWAPLSPRPCRRAVRSVRSGVLLDVATLPTVGMADRHGRVRLGGGVGCTVGDSDGCKHRRGVVPGAAHQSQHRGAAVAALASVSSCTLYDCLPLVQPVPLNRYALDYWKHGQKDALVAANGMREGDAWQVRFCWCRVLAAPRTPHAHTCS